MTFFFPLFLILFVGICLKYVLPFVFNLVGWRGGIGFVFEERIGAILFLASSAVLAGIAYWYPCYVATYHAYEDDRYGFVILFAFPFYFIGAAISGIAFYRLMRVVMRGKRGRADAAFVVCGSMLALAGISPLVMIGWGMLSIGAGH